jgi:hypothetical protein
MKFKKTVIAILIPLFFSGCCTLSVFPGGTYYCFEMNFKDSIKKGNYKEAFELLNTDGLELSTYDLQVSYDILNVLVNGRNIKKEDLYTYKTYKKYPNSIAWTMLSTKILIIYLDTGKLDKNAIETFEKYVPKHSKHNYFWLKALKNLRK